MSMTPKLPWAAKAASRLRHLISVVSGDGNAPEIQVRSCISEELEILLKEVPADEQKEALRALLDHFPGIADCFSTTPISPASSPSPTPSGMEMMFQGKPLSSLELVNQLADAWPRMGDQERAACERKLSEAGIAPTASKQASFGSLTPHLTLDKNREQDAVLGVEMLKAR